MSKRSAAHEQQKWTDLIRLWTQGVPGAFEKIYQNFTKFVVGTTLLKERQIFYLVVIEMPFNLRYISLRSDDHQKFDLFSWSLNLFGLNKFFYNVSHKTGASTLKLFVVVVKNSRGLYINLFTAIIDSVLLESKCGYLS